MDPLYTHLINVSQAPSLLPPNPSLLPPENRRQLSGTVVPTSSLLTAAYLHIITLIPLNSPPALYQTAQFIFLDVMALSSH